VVGINCKGRQVDQVAGQLGFEDSYRIPRSSLPVDDTWGVRIACMSMVRSLAPGINPKRIQHGTMKDPVALYQLLAYAVIGGEKKKTLDSTFHNERDLRILVCKIG
jgi:hypothetical protein